jgi:hypothetical protein
MYRKLEAIAYPATPKVMTLRNELPRLTLRGAPGNASTLTSYSFLR